MLEKIIRLELIQSTTIRFQGTRLNVYQGLPKRLLDIAFAVALLPTVAIVVAILALITRMDGGPSFFGHTRVGMDGKPFKCWKIRTMKTDSQEQLTKLLAEDPVAREEWETERKLTNDPRITCIGGFLRRASLDELPQLFNVIKGEMSLVGPRPVPKDELLQNYGEHASAYKSVRPGVTGLWQVSGRNDVSYGERVAMDVMYKNNASFALDTKILFMTIGAVLDRTGK